MQIRSQNNVEVNGNIEQSEESKDGSEAANSTVSSLSLVDKPSSPISSGDVSTIPDVVPTSSFSELPSITPETSENKPTKSIKVSYYFYICYIHPLNQIYLESSKYKFLIFHYTQIRTCRV